MYKLHLSIDMIKNLTTRRIIYIFLYTELFIIFYYNNTHETRRINIINQKKNSLKK